MAQDSALENPFNDMPGSYQPPDMQVPSAEAPCPAALGPVIAPEPAPTRCPMPTTLSELLFADGRKTPADTRCGAFQDIFFVNTYLPRMGANGFGWYDAELTSVWGVPFPTTDAPLVITPGIATHWLDGPDSPDIPAQLHDNYTDFRRLPKIGDRFRLDVAVRPGYYSDWDGSSSRAIRVTGHVSGIYDYTPTLQLVLGAAYLDRPDIEVLPIAGVIWKPNQVFDFQLVFPTPKIAVCIAEDDKFVNRRMFFTDWEPPKNEYWLYTAGELGGGTWAIRHSDGSSDLMSYGDWRVFAGVETRTIRGLSSHIEAGYVFHRIIRLSSTGEDTQVGNTAMVRAGLNY